MTKAAAMTTTTTTDDDDDNDGGYGGRDGHHRMRKGRGHDNETIHNNKIGRKRWLQGRIGRRLWEVDRRGGGGSIEKEEESKER